MKIKLEIELEVPDVCEEMPNDELDQLLFDTYINYVTISHHRDALRFMSENVSDLANYHATWGDICSSANFVIKKDK